MIKFKSILKTAFFSLEESLERDSFNNEPYYRIAGNDSVIACILDDEDNFLMVEQYRACLERNTIEFPAGAIDFGEDSIQAVKRELMEELGIVCSILPLSGNYTLMMSGRNIRDHLFFGMDISGEKKKPEKGILVKKIQRKSLLDYALSGSFHQLAGIGMLQLAGKILGLDICQCDYLEIENAFMKNKNVF